MHNNDMSQAEFEISYDGPATAAGRMDVRELGPALLGLGYLVSDANESLNGDAASVSISVRAGFKKGSFGVVFDVIQKAIHDPISTFISPEATAAANLLQILGFASGAGISLIALIRKARGRKPTSVEPVNKNESKVTYNTGDGNSQTFIVNNGTLTLYESPSVRRDIAGITEPLRGGGIDSIKIKQGGEEVERITADEAPLFEDVDITESAEPTNVSEYTAILRVSAPYLESRKWRLSDNSQTEWYSIDDEEFWSAVQRRTERFGAGDQLRANVRLQQWERSDGSFRTQKSIIRVTRHVEALPAPETGNLPFRDDQP